MVSVPPGAKREARLAGGVMLWDVSHLLPMSMDTAPTHRAFKLIVRAYTHHSGALGYPGFRGARGTARYVVEQRGFPCAAYHYWIPFDRAEDEDGNLVVYRLVPDGVRSWHTGGQANTRGVGVCWQGNLRKSPPSLSQYECAEALYPWLVERYSFDSPKCFGLHCELDEYNTKAKATCPGPYVTDWVTRARKGYFA